MDNEDYDMDVPSSQAQPNASSVSSKSTSENEKPILTPPLSLKPNAEMEISSSTPMKTLLPSITPNKPILTPSMGNLNRPPPMLNIPQPLPPSLLTAIAQQQQQFIPLGRKNIHVNNPSDTIRPVSFYPSMNLPSNIPSSKPVNLSPSPVENVPTSSSPLPVPPISTNNIPPAVAHQISEKAKQIELEEDKNLLELLQSLQSFIPILPDELIEYYMMKAGLDISDVKMYFINSRLILFNNLII